MMDWTGWGAAGAFAMIVGMLLLAALAVTALALIIRPVFGSRSQADPERHSRRNPAGERDREHGPALEIMEERYARGEISRDEFLGLRRGLFEGGTLNAND